MIASRRFCVFLQKNFEKILRYRNRDQNGLKIFIIFKFTRLIIIARNTRYQHLS